MFSTTLPFSSRVYRVAIHGIIITSLMWSFTSCKHGKYIHKSNLAIQSSHDSLAIEVGVKEGNLVYFIIENQRQFDNLALDTTVIDLAFGVGEQHKGDLLITNMVRDDPHHLNTQLALVKCDSFIYYERRVNTPINRFGLMLDIILLDGQQAFYYDKDIRDTVLNYKRIETVRVGQVLPIDIR